jgi:hypothetical protein
VKGKTPEEASKRARGVFDACAERDLHLALVKLPEGWFEPETGAASSSGVVTCLRSVLMKPEHEAWMDRIWERLAAACAEVVVK